MSYANPALIPVKERHRLTGIELGWSFSIPEVIP